MNCKAYELTSTREPSVLLESIRSYWDRRSAGYSKKTRQDLDDAGTWLARLQPWLSAPRMKILDIGCGPGFFSVLLAGLGHQLTAFDYSSDMLAEAGANARRWQVSLTLQQGDAQDLPFADESFDLVVSRNLTWNLPSPHQAYAEWLRVLKSGACLVNFDGNHYRYLYNDLYTEEQKRLNAMSHTPQLMQGVDPAVMEDIARDLPLSRVDRPAWDREVLSLLGAADISVQEETCPATFQGRSRDVVMSFCIAATKA